MEATINLRTRLGWGYCTSPSGETPYSIHNPERPTYEGTYNQVTKEISRDRTFNNLGGAFYSTAWFYQGRRITHIWAAVPVYDADYDKILEWKEGWLKYDPFRGTNLSEDELREGMRIRTD